MSLFFMDFIMHGGVPPQYPRAVPGPHKVAIWAGLGFLVTLASDSHSARGQLQAQPGEAIGEVFPKNMKGF